MATSLREKKKHRTRADILAAAAECFEREGYRNANMRDIAASADVAYQTLYNYFPSKARIARALLAQDAGDAEALPGDEADVVARLAAFADSLARRVFAGDREVWRAAVVEAIRNDATPAAGCLDPMLRERVVELLDAAQQHGHLDAYLDTAAMASVAESLVGSALLDWVTTGEGDADAAARALAHRIELILTPYLRIAG